MYERNKLLNSICQHNHFITQGNYKATCFNCRLVILRPILSIVSQAAMHTLGFHRVYNYGIHQIYLMYSIPFCQLCHKMLCTRWDPKVYIVSCDTIDK